MHPFLNIAVSAARSAGKQIAHFYDRLEEVEVTEKAQNDIVSEVDKLVEQELIEHIQKAYPNHTILSEEAGLIASKSDEYCWVIDPLDGTANFVQGFPQFAISIAVKKGDQLEVACIYDPIKQELFTAARGKGAHLNNKRIRIGDKKKLATALIGTGFPFRHTEYLPTYLTSFCNILPKCSDIRRAGSAALDLAYVACGRLDGFWEPRLKEWDIAAGALIVKEAGGVVSDFNNKKDYLSSGNIVAGNVRIHAQLQRLVEKDLV